MDGEYCRTGRFRGLLCMKRPHIEGSYHAALDGDTLVFWRKIPLPPEPKEAQCAPAGGSDAAPSDCGCRDGMAHSSVGPLSGDVQRAREMGYTGVPCGRCGSPNTRFEGTCLKCSVCHHHGGCG